jgi:hypothetical protein
MATFGNDDVCWLDVSVNDSLRVRGVQTVGNSDRHTQQRFQFHRPTADDVLQRVSGEL